MLVRRLVGKRTFASSRSQRGAMERFLNQSSKMRQPSAIRALQPLLKVPGMISLGGGMPNPSTFPISTIQIQLKAGGETIQLTAQETEMALQYSQTAGLPELLEILAQLQRSVHNRPSVQANNQICITTGSQDGLYKAFQMVLSEGDSLLAESPTYSGTLALLRPMQCRIFGT